MWKERNGRDYYYRSVRKGGRVISEYIGAGELAALVARQDKIRQAERVAKRAERRRQIEAGALLDGEIAEYAELVRTLTAAALLASGCHRHKRQWRVKREQ